MIIMEIIADTGLKPEILPFWNDLDETQKRFAAENCMSVFFDRCEMIQGGAGSCLGMVYVDRGRLRVYISSEDGREITLFHAEEGDCCVFSAACVISRLDFDTSVTAEAGTRLLVLNNHAFEKLGSENVYVRCFMYELAAKRFSQVMDVMQSMLFSGFDRRLARFLLEQCENNGGNEIKMTQKLIAEEVNSAREVVARMLHRFSRAGLVEVGRGKITVVDYDGLKALL